MVDTSVVIDSDLVGGLQAGTFAFTFVANDVTQGALISNQTDGFDSTIVTLGQGRYPGDVDPGHIFFRASYDHGALQSKAALEAGVEHSVAITFDGSSASIYIDGVLDIRKQGDFSIPGYLGSIAAIGNWLAGGQTIMPAFAGTISQTYLFDVAIGQASAKALSTGAEIRTTPTFACTDDGQGNLTISGGVADDDLFGADRKDALSGRSGNDDIKGARGRDWLDGGAGDDDLWGGLGADDLIGGRGSDVFHFTTGEESGTGRGRDIVHDFETGQDRVDLSAMPGLVFVGEAAFSGAAGEVRFRSGKGFVEIDLDGDGLADSQILMRFVSAMVADDFILASG